MTFQKGKSGNPDGRPAIARDFREQCRDFMEKRGWKRLRHLATSDGPHTMRATELIAAYAYGRPTERFESASIIAIAELDDDRLGSIAQRLAGRGPGVLPPGSG